MNENENENDYRDQAVTASERLMGAGRAAGRPWTLGLLVVLLVGCGPLRQSGPPAGGVRPLPVVSTVLPVTLFSRAVAGDCARVTPLLPPGVGPHGFQARPSDPALLREARVLVSNGLGMEAFLERLVAAAGNRELTVIDSSHGIATLSGGDGQVSGDHHDHADDGHARGDSGHAHTGVNPHIWLDPQRAAQQVATIRDGLIRADPACAATYRRNAERAIGTLRALDREIEAALKPHRGRTFVTLHAFAPYFAERYGLREEVLVGTPELDPSPRDLQRISATVRRTGVRALLSEPRQEHRSFQALAGDLGLPVLRFDPLESGDAAGDLDTYVRTMRRNVAALRQALGEAPLSPGAATPPG